MNINFRIQVKADLDKSEHEEVYRFMLTRKTFSVEQYPFWPSMLKQERGKGVLFCAYMESVLIGYCQVVQKGFGICKINFGPIANTAEVEKKLVDYIVKYYRKRFYFLLIVQPSMDSKLYEKLNNNENYSWMKGVSVKRYSWVTKRIDLEQGLEKITSGFSENLKRSLKKGSKLAIKVRKIQNKEDLIIFIDGYIRLYERRHLPINRNSTSEDLNCIYQVGVETGLFTFYEVVFDSQVVGGLLIAHQGDTFFYLKGYSDNRFKELPVTHSGFQYIIEEGIRNGIKWFDLGGYNPYASSTDQVFQINRFKSMFTKDITMYPEALFVDLVPGASWIFMKIKKIKIEK